jgi:hypothetical protein
MRDGNGHVLFLAAGIGETQINELDFVVLQHLHYICGGPCHSYLLSQKGVSTPTGRATGAFPSKQKLCQLFSMSK